VKTRTVTIALLVGALFAAPAVAYSIYDISRILKEANQSVETIHLRSGTHYFLLGSVLWVLLAMQLLALGGKEAKVRKWGGNILIGWFVACLFLANIIPVVMSSHLRGVGYYQCAVVDVSATHRRGNEYIYSRLPCDRLRK